MASLHNQRFKTVYEEFPAFKLWKEADLKNMIISSKERVLNNDECLMREEQSQNYVYLLLKGKVRIER